jgi:hypothetical protein
MAEIPPNPTRSWRPPPVTGGLRLAVLLSLLLLAAYGLLSLRSGLLASTGHSTADLMVRFREFSVFRQGIYPLRALVYGPVPRGFPTSVYPPYALPMFALFFTPGGAAQGWRLVQGLSLLSLLPIGWIGWRSLRFAGPAAGLLGALAPVAIGGNSNCLFHGQFSMICMGLISLQWLLLEGRRPLAAGLCWTLAMIKPQIAAAFALPLLQPGYRRGLLLGMAQLLCLSALALAFTGIAPLRYLDIWLQKGRLDFAQAGTINLMTLLGAWAGGLALLVVLGGCWWLSRLLGGRMQTAEPSSLPTPGPVPAANLRLQGLCAVLGALGVYHINYDNIMLFPALLAILALALRRPTVWNRLLAAAMAASLWAPVHLSADRLGPQGLMAAIWLAVGLTLLANAPERWQGGGSAAGPSARSSPGSVA